MTSAKKPRLPRLKRFSYHAAFSYFHDDAEYVDGVRAALAKKIKVYDYKTDESFTKFAGLELEQTLQHIYEFEAMFVFAFISKAYFKNKNPLIEWEAATRASARKPRYLIPVRREDPEREISTIWLNGTLPAEKLADLIDGTIRHPPPAPWWFYWSRGAKVAAAVLLLAVGLWFWPSRTSLKSADANAEGIIAHVVNVGPKTCTLVGQRLKFGSVPIEDVELRLKSGSPTIFPGEHDVTLNTFELVTKCGADGFLLTKREVEPLLGNQPVTLEIDIRESDDAPGKWRRKSVTFPAAHLKPLVERLVFGYDTLCPEDSRLRFALSDRGAR